MIKVQWKTIILEILFKLIHMIVHGCYRFDRFFLIDFIKSD